MCPRTSLTSSSRYRLGNHGHTNAVHTMTSHTLLYRAAAQRRRWLNGAFFALVYYLTNFARVLKDAKHNVFRKFFLLLQFTYMLTLLVLNWLVRECAQDIPSNKPRARGLLIATRRVCACTLRTTPGTWQLVLVDLCHLQGWRQAHYVGGG